VLDLGTRDGYFAFELERRGATVVAVDYLSREETGFAVVADLLGSKVEYLHENLYNLTPRKVGTFDVVLFLGLLYHLPDPIQALKVVRELCRNRLCLETHAIDNGFLLPDGKLVPLREVSPLLADVPLMQFFPGRSLYNDPTNYWGPNLKCLEEMLRECKFAVVSHELYGGRAVVNCQGTEDADLDHHHQIARGLNSRR
jgi:tRNA (mo5U34)-methyltransferase